MYYTIEVIKAVWPVAIIMGLIAIPILTWIMHPREKRTKVLRYYFEEGGRLKVLITDYVNSGALAEAK